MDAQEQKDLEVLKQAIVDRKIRCFDYQEALLGMTPETLRCSGHQSTEDAVKWAVQRAMSEIKKLVDAHLRKYPD